MSTKYRIYCITESSWQYQYSDTPISVCPINGAHTINANSVTEEFVSNIDHVVCNMVTGEIKIGHLGNDIKTVYIGNTSTNARIFNRYTYIIRSVPVPTSLADSSATLTIAQLLTGILTINATIARTLTLPTGTLIVEGVPSAIINDGFEFAIINIGLGLVTVALGTNGTVVGSLGIPTITSGRYLLRITNITASSEAYVIYRT